ncbi:hypothetical protein HYS11_00950 [Candidatus Gottesmanbacteria bacterium]|nr:hypothetical protein [Candidatus Gottesmanbacteria bacterium]MBI3443403.1 hypothetical protein [Candidatus Woesebacteria bacterium]
MSQIRLNKTPELEEVLAFLRSKYLLLSEAEIIKVALAEKYSKEVSTPLVDEETEKLIAKGLEDYKNGRYTVVKTDKELNTYLKSL